MRRNRLAAAFGTLVFLFAAAGFGATLTGCSCDDTQPNHNCLPPQ